MVETISQIVLNTVKTYPKDALMLYKKEGKYVPISTEEFGNRVKYLSLGLKELGLNPQDKLLILAENGPDWVTTDFATLCLGGITVPVYTSLVPDQIRYIIDDSDAKVVVCSSRDLWQKIEVIKSQLMKVNHYIIMESEAPEGAIPYAHLIERGKKIAQESPGLFEKMALEAKPEDLASIIYTSGTTGIPKGVMLTHGNFISNIKTLDSVVEFIHTDVILSFLPLSHVLERMTTFSFLYKGCTIGYAESVETVADNLLEIRPTIMISVPRLFDKIYAKVIDSVLTGSALKKKIFYWALKVGKKYGERKLANAPLSGFLQFKRNLAHKLVFSKILEKTGGRVKFFVSGGAPLSKDVAEFFYALGLVILEGYGLTETSPVIAVNTFENMRFGTVGKPIPGVEVKIAEDGEILAKGPNVMKGYYKKEAETKEVFEGGWFHTGDIGYLDKDGFLVITDRKKDLIVTAGGKNVAPQPIENMIKTNPYVSSVLVLGNNRRFISAIVVPDFEKLEPYARLKNIPYESLADLVKKQEIVDFLLAEIDRSTPNLASYEKVKRIILLDKDFEIEADEMTPTLKVKRNIVEQKYKNVIDSLYRE
jgi:long-chain acyl-CoA synthetase